MQYTDINWFRRFFKNYANLGHNYQEMFNSLEEEQKLNIVSSIKSYNFAGYVFAFIAAGAAFIFFSTAWALVAAPIFALAAYIAIFAITSFALLGEDINKQYQANRHKSERIFEKTIDDKNELEQKLFFNHGGSGQPLAFYGGQRPMAEELNHWSQTFKNRERFTFSCEDRGLILGVSGTGKTSYLVCQIIDWMSSGKSFVASDVKPEIWAILHAGGAFKHFDYDVTIFNPMTDTSHRYNMFEDMLDDDDIDELAQIFIPHQKGDAESFNVVARRLLKAFLLQTKQQNGKTSLAAVRQYMSKLDTNEIIEELTDSDNETVRFIGGDLRRSAGNERFMSSCFTALSSALQFLDNSKIRGSISESDFSMREQLQKPRQAIFLQFDQQSFDKTAPLYSALVAHVLRLLQIEYQQRDDVLVLLDEIINAAPIPNITKKLNVMRSSKMPTMLYLQTLRGFDELYGERSSEMFMSSCNYKVCYRVNDNLTAQNFSEQIGKTNVINRSAHHGQQASGNVMQDVESSSETITREYILEPAELLQLERGDAVVIYEGKSARVEMPRHYLDTPVNVKVDGRKGTPTADEFDELIN